MQHATTKESYLKVLEWVKENSGKIKFTDISKKCGELRTNRAINYHLLKLGYVHKDANKVVYFTDKHISLSILADMVYAHTKQVNKEMHERHKKEDASKNISGKDNEISDAYLIDILKQRGYKISKEVIKYF